MFMDGLPFIVVFRIQLPITTGDGLRSLIGFETEIAYLMIMCLLLVA